jgi:hypothetical protein
VSYSTEHRGALLASLREKGPQGFHTCPSCGYGIYPPPVPLSDGTLWVRCGHCGKHTAFGRHEYDASGAWRGLQ